MPSVPRGQTRLAAVAGVLTAAIVAFMVAPMWHDASQARAFLDAGQKELGPAGDPLLPRTVVEALERADQGGGTWAVVTPPLRESSTDPAAVGELIALRAIRGELPYRPSDGERISTELYRESRSICGDINYVGWLAYQMLPRALDCRHPHYVLYWRVRAPITAVRIAQGPDWTVVSR